MDSSGTFTKENLFKGLLLFLVIALGIFAGLTLAVKSGFTQASQPIQTLKPENRTNIKPGDIFASLIPGFRVDQMAVTRPTDFSGRHLVAFLAPGCEPCDDFIRFISTEPAALEQKYGVTL